MKTLDRSTLRFVRSCDIETLPFEGEDGNVIAVFRFDTRLIGGDYTIIKIEEEFASISAARYALLQEVKRWEGVL